jgi:hypothetical protein
MFRRHGSITTGRSRNLFSIGSGPRSAASSAQKNSPVTYVVFDGMSQRNLSKIDLLVRPAQNRAAEQVQNSIEQAVIRGNVEFRTLRVDNTGRVS